MQPYNNTQHIHSEPDFGQANPNNNYVGKYNDLNFYKTQAIEQTNEHNENKRRELNEEEIRDIVNEYALENYDSLFNNDLQSEINKPIDPEDIAYIEEPMLQDSKTQKTKATDINIIAALEIEEQELNQVIADYKQLMDEVHKKIKAISEDYKQKRYKLKKDYEKGVVDQETIYQNIAGHRKDIYNKQKEYVQEFDAMRTNVSQAVDKYLKQRLNLYSTNHYKKIKTIETYHQQKLDELKKDYEKGVVDPRIIVQKLDVYERNMYKEQKENEQTLYNELEVHQQVSDEIYKKIERIGEDYTQKLKKLIQEYEKGVVDQETIYQKTEKKTIVNNSNPNAEPHNQRNFRNKLKQRIDSNNQKYIDL